MAKRSQYSNIYLISPSTSSTRLLDENVSRIGATIFNDTNKILYAKMGETASLTSYTVQIPSYGYFEIPYIWVGIIDGIWDADVSGTGALLTEFN